MRVPVSGPDKVAGFVFFPLAAGVTACGPVSGRGVPGLVSRRGMAAAAARSVPASVIVR